MDSETPRPPLSWPQRLFLCLLAAILILLGLVMLPYLLCGRFCLGLVQ